LLRLGARRPTLCSPADTALFPRALEKGKKDAAPCNKVNYAVSLFG